MALIECWECKKQVSSTAASCPHCGAPPNTSANAAAGRPLQVTDNQPMPSTTPKSIASDGANTKKLLTAISVLVFALILIKTCDSSNTLPEPAAGPSERVLANSAGRPVDSVALNKSVDSILRAIPVSKIPNMELSALAVPQALVNSLPSTPERRVWLAAAEKRFQIGAQRAAEESAAAEIKSSAACPVSTTRAIASRRRHPSWDSETLAAILCGRVRIGMTADQARAAWGTPNDINRSAYSFGVHEQWVYDGGYLYFEDGLLTSIQN